MDFVNYNPNNNDNSNMQYGFESSDDDMDVEDPAVVYGNLTLLANVNIPIIIIEAEDDASVIDDTTVEMDTSASRSRSGKYKQYDESDIHRFINIMEEQRPTIAEVAREYNIPHSTAYKMINEWE